MEYRQYGRTGLKVSTLSMGGMRFERPDDVDDMARIPLLMYDAGVNYFDTAPGYCKDKSEEIVGAAVRQMVKRQSAGGHDFYVSTKSNKPDAATVRSECERSLKRLGVERIDFYHIWCIRSWAEWEARKAGGAVKEFHKLKDEGLVRHVVVSHHLDSQDTQRLLAEDQVEGMLLGFNSANWRFRLGGIEEAGRRQLGVMVMNPLGGGVLWQAPDKFQYLKRRPGDDLVRGALRFVLSHPEVTGCLAGVRSLADAQAAVEAWKSLELYSAAELADVRQAALEGFADLCTGCGYCKECPQDIPVSALMETCNFALLGNPEAAFGRLKWHWGVENVDELVEKCIDCGRCEELCTQHLPIRERFAIIREAWEQGKPKT